MAEECASLRTTASVHIFTKRNGRKPEANKFIFYEIKARAEKQDFTSIIKQANVEHSFIRLCQSYNILDFVTEMQLLEKGSGKLISIDGNPAWQHACNLMRTASHQYELHCEYKFAVILLSIPFCCFRVHFKFITG